MNPNQSKISPLVKKIIYPAIFLLILVVAVIGGTVINFYLKKTLTFSSSDTLAIWIIAFTLASVLKINIQSRIFLFNLFFSVLLVSFYPFGQGLIIFLILICLQKLFKIL